MSASPKRPSARAPDVLLAAQDASLDWNALEDLIHRDAGARGLASYRKGGISLDRGQLRAAALDLAENSRSVAIVTGFCSVLSDRVTAETDGPPGALFLAQLLHSLGIEVTIITDRYALPLVESGCAQSGLDRKILVEFPFERGAADDPARTRNDAPKSVKIDHWVDEFLSHGRGRNLSHLVAIERPGPSHTLESVMAQPRDAAATLERFREEVPDDERDVCHDMHGSAISVHTAKTHRLFEVVLERRLPITTIGIGDGGNEIGMGRFSWEDLVCAIGGAAAGRIACRIGTDFALIAGVSNWGAYALALAVAQLRGQVDASRWLRPDGQRELIETMVTSAGAVDGRTLLSEPSVDGLSMDVYLAPLTEMHVLLARAPSADR
ncbi:MAG: glutamate cyclase domain-containing protein [Pirellulales bacterium]